MYHESKQKVTEGLKSWLEPSNPHRTAAVLAEISGVGEAYISTIKNGKYTIGNSAIADKHFHALAKAIGVSLGRPALLWETENLKRISNLCALAQGRARRGIIDGHSGAGKTHGLEQFERNNEKVLYIKCTTSMKRKDMLLAIVSRLRIQLPERYTEHSLMKLIEAKVTGEPGWVILIDETEDITSALWFAIKEIEDFTRNKCGLVVAGIGVKAQIDKLAEKGKKGFPQLKRRLFPNCLMLRSVGAKEVKDICRSHGLLDDKALSWFAANVRDYDMLSQYMSDLLEVFNDDLSKVDASQVVELFTL